MLYSCEEQAKGEQLSDHIAIDSFLVELVDPKTLEPVKERDPGANVVTALTRFGMPAVRFLLGDWLEISWKRCRCGRSLPLAKGGVTARSDDLIIVKGVNIYPSLVEDAVRSIKGLAAEYRLKQTKTKAVVLVEAGPLIPKSEYQNLAKALQDEIKGRTMVTIEIEILEPGTLPREEVKSKRIIKEI